MYKESPLSNVLEPLEIVTFNISIRVYLMAYVDAISVKLDRM